MSSDNTKPVFHKERHNISQDSSGDHVIRTTQVIPDSFLDKRKAERNEADSRSRIGDDMRVATVPRFLLNKWKAQDGFDPLACREADEETQMHMLREMRRRLITEGYAYLLNTNKTF